VGLLGPNPIHPHPYDHQSPRLPFGHQLQGGTGLKKVEPIQLVVEIFSIWVFPKIGGKPQNGWVIMENPTKIWMILGYHYFWKHPYLFEHFGDFSGKPWEKQNLGIELCHVGSLL